MNEQLRQDLLNSSKSPGMMRIRARADQFHAELVEHVSAMPPEVWHSFVLSVLEASERGAMEADAALEATPGAQPQHPGADAVRELINLVGCYGIFKLGEELEEIARREAEPA